MLYSPLKVFHHQDRIEKMRNGEQIVPVQVQLIISDLCNHDCNFCAYRMTGYSSNQLFTLGSQLAEVGHNNPIRWIKYNKVLEILEDCAEMGVKAIQLTGGGEPSVHPQFELIVRKILDLKLDLALVTNGVNIKPDTLREATWVRVSVDAGRPDTYCQIRGVSETHWNRVWKNISAFDGPIVGVGFVVTKDNFNEIYDCASRAKDAGANNIRISAVFQNEGVDYFDQLWGQIATELKRTRKLQDVTFDVFDNFGERVYDLEQKSPSYERCGYQDFVTYIGGDLNVYRCCVLAYNERGIIGSLKEQRFKDMWKNHSSKGFDARGCPRCMFNGKNETILYAIQTDPPHVNFV